MLCLKIIRNRDLFIGKSCLDIIDRTCDPVKRLEQNISCKQRKHKDNNYYYEFYRACVLIQNVKSSTDIISRYTGKYDTYYRLNFFFLAVFIFYNLALSDRCSDLNITIISIINRCCTVIALLKALYNLF